MAIDQAHLSNLQLNNLQKKSVVRISSINLHTQFTQKKWDAALVIAIQQPHPFLLKLQIYGNPAHYQTHLSLQGAHTNWNLMGIGDKQHLSLNTEKNKLLNGTLDMHLQLHWQTAMQWQGHIHANQINFSLINPNWINHFSMQINSNGDNAKPFSTTSDIHVSMPNGTFHLSIKHQKIWHITWHFKMHALSHWFDKTSGYAESRGKIDGDLTNPHFNIFFHSTLHTKKEKLHDIQATLSGDFKKHILRSDIVYQKQKMHLQLDGDWHDQQWIGNLKKLTIITSPQQVWHLNKPTHIMVTKKVITITPLCLVLPNAGDICITGKSINQKLDASININIHHFNWLQVWARNLHIPKGKLHAHFKIAGDINHPKITGALELNQGSIIFPRLNLTLHNISAAILSDGKILNFTASADSLNQPVQLKGFVDLFQPIISGQITITSNHFPIINTEEYAVFVSSDLNVAIKGNQISVTGQINIPKARIQPNDYQTVETLPANDVVYVGDITPPPIPFWKTQVDIMLHIGNDVHLKASGITAQLGGSIRLQQGSTGDFFGTGQITAQKGVYSLYGQTLTVSPDSSLNFTHSLINNPTLNIKASKVIQSISTLGFSGFSGFSRDNLIVGVELQGSIKSPKVTFFSNRANLSQANILSYLLLGYSNSSSTAGNTDLLIRALGAIDLKSQGLLGKENIASQIQSGLGLNELGVESETTVDALGNPLDKQSAFVVGKSLSRHFYVRYSFGLLTPVNVFELRYLFNENWAIQTDSSSLGNGADILYTISTD